MGTLGHFAGLDHVLEELPELSSCAEGDDWLLLLLEWLGGLLFRRFLVV